MAITKQDVINYVTESPHNTNKAVLSSILDQYAVNDNKTEIELLAQENKVYIPANGKVYNKVTVNVPPKEEIELSATENKVYTPAEGKVYNKVTVNVPAPASDYSSAQVVINNEEALYTWELWLPIIESNQITMEECSSSGTYVVPLYKGVMVTEERGGAPAPTITGDCTYDNGTLTITGDCIINFGGSSEQ